MATAARTSVVLALCCLLLGVAASSAGAFAIKRFDGALTTQGGQPAMQAGDHPYQVSVEIDFPTVERNGQTVTTDGTVKDFRAALPPGLVGNPKATPQCPLAAFGEREFLTEDQGECPSSSAIGVAIINIGIAGSKPAPAPVFNLKPAGNQPALFGFHFATATVFLHPRVRSSGDYGLTVDIENVSQALPISSTELTLWGVPADPSHDDERGECLEQPGGPPLPPCPSDGPPRPFLTNPTSCGGPLRFDVDAVSWQEPLVHRQASFRTHDSAGNPVGVTGCNQLDFEPTIRVAPDGPTRADSATGLEIELDIPQVDEVGRRATAQLKKSVITLPEGMAVNASVANGLGACSPSQIALDADRAASACPDSAKIGTVEIVSPLIENPLRGAVYLARQRENPFGNLFAIYLVATSVDGVEVKIPGRIDMDPRTGQVTATIDNAPQVPFTDLDIDLFGGEGAALVAPRACGTYTITAALTPWSGAAPAVQSSSFEVGSGPGGGACPGGAFEPKLSAGMVDATAGKFSSFLLRLTRADGTQRLTGLDATLPTGLLARLSGVPYCSEAALASIPTVEASGALQVASPSCAPASRVGSVSAQAGVGPSPFFLDTGKVYLAGPYKGAPISLAIVTPALAGPFDLGNVVIRVALQVDPESAQVKAASDPIPTVVAGVPLNLRELRVNLDRQRFLINPTSCGASAVNVTLSGSEGATSAFSEPFATRGCAALSFAPKLSLRLKGPTKRSGFPALTVTLDAPGGAANIARVSVALPRSEFLAQSHIRGVCTRVQFAAGAHPGEGCPSGSIYGTAQAFSPLLDKPLEGPVYLRSGSNALPDLVVALRGQLDVVLSGRVDSFKGGIRTRLDTVPDAPISKFVLRMKGGKKGLVENSRDLCAAKDRASIQLTAQNGKVVKRSSAIATTCRKSKPKKRR